MSLQSDFLGRCPPPASQALGEGGRQAKVPFEMLLLASAEEAIRPTACPGRNLFLLGAVRVGFSSKKAVRPQPPPTDFLAT